MDKIRILFWHSSVSVFGTLVGTFTAGTFSVDFLLCILAVSSLFVYKKQTASMLFLDDVPEIDLARQTARLPLDVGVEEVRTCLRLCIVGEKALFLHS